MRRTSAILPPLACPTWCQDDGSCEQWMCLLYKFGRLNTECSLGTDAESRSGSFNESCLWKHHVAFLRALFWKTAAIYPSLPSTNASGLSRPDLFYFNFVCFCLIKISGT